MFTRVGKLERTNISTRNFNMPQSFTFALSGIPYYPDFLISHAYFEAWQPSQPSQPLQQVLTCEYDLVAFSCDH